MSEPWNTRAQMAIINGQMQQLRRDLATPSLAEANYHRNLITPTRYHDENNPLSIFTRPRDNFNRYDRQDRRTIEATQDQHAEVTRNLSRQVRALNQERGDLQVARYLHAREAINPSNPFASNVVDRVPSDVLRYVLPQYLTAGYNEVDPRDLRRFHNMRGVLARFSAPRGLIGPPPPDQRQHMMMRAVMDELPLGVEGRAEAQIEFNRDANQGSYNRRAADMLVAGTRRYRRDYPTGGIGSAPAA